MDWNTTAFSIVGVLALGWLINWQTGRINELKAERDSLTSQLSEQVAINKDYKYRIQSLHELDTLYTQELTNAKTEIDTLRDAVKSGNKRVYIKAECPKAGADTAESGSNEAAPRLSEATEQDYWRLREMMAENEKQTLYLQDYIRTECLR
ncbi:lysis protein [Morganella morganii]|uniref:lysis protein n=1 Tax=Morganella morganii TaxID=582 RepID=UPI000468C631|nr:lysis protein [Morganella morganii]MCU6224203.1 lysis protein [Morganella morganii]MCU6235327.1 lysis protein [Morganella morganii]